MFGKRCIIRNNEYTSSSCGEGTQHGGAPLDPEVGGLLPGRQVHGHDKGPHAQRVVVARTHVAVWNVPGSITLTQ